MSSINVYACLVCGRFFQGKGKSTPAFEHSLEYEHEIYMNLETGKVYVLPDNEEIVEEGVEDI
jgi:U4/U6.U5 tri-snRNP-associated protein 2